MYNVHVYQSVQFILVTRSVKLGPLEFELTRVTCLTISEFQKHNDESIPKENYYFFFFALIENTCTRY